MATHPLMWRDDYAIGVEELDHEHRDLFNRINQLHEALAMDDDPVRIEACLGEIQARVGAHFALEEAVMREHGFESYATHKAEHDEFLDVIVDLCHAFMSDPDPQRRDNLEFQLQAWIINHVVTSDQDLAGLRDDDD